MVTTNYLWDELSPYGDVVAEFDGANSLTASYVLGGTRLIAQTRGTVDSYYLFDAMSVRHLTDASGAITDSYDYTAFGEMHNQTGTTVNPYRYTGQYQDAATGLYNLRARHYDPGVGRFLSRDTYAYNFRNPVELNRYGYVSNCPTCCYDPTGLNLVFAYAGGIGESGVRTTATATPLGLATAELLIGVFITTLSIASIANLVKLEKARCKRLNKDMHRVCDQPRKCNSQTSCSEIKRRFMINIDCMIARQIVRLNCAEFDPNPLEHMKKIAETEASAGKCLYEGIRKSCF